MRFNKQLFNQNADSQTKRLLPQSHIDVLDGMEVVFSHYTEWGHIPRYEVNGEAFYLYPVHRGWCTK